MWYLKLRTAPMSVHSLIPHALPDPPAANLSYLSAVQV